MKKLLITVNGVRFEVEVEVIHDDDDELLPYQMYQIQRKSPESYTTPQENAFLRSQTYKTQSKISSQTKQVIDNDLHSPINGIIREIKISEGDFVHENDVLFIIESMKMKTRISSPRDGKIAKINVKVGDSIETGHLLLTFE